MPDDQIKPPKKMPGIYWEQYENSKKKGAKK
jgi:hypothetical protein